jgi:hypothetical protein
MMIDYNYQWHDNTIELFSKNVYNWNAFLWAASIFDGWSVAISIGGQPTRVILPLPRVPRHHNDATTIMEVNLSKNDDHEEVRLILRTLVPLTAGAQVCYHIITVLSEDHIE